MQILLLQVFTDVKAAEVQRYVDALCNEISLVSQLPVMGTRPAFRLFRAVPPVFS